MKNRKKYIAPEMVSIQLIAEPFMSQSNDPFFSNKPGIEQTKNYETSNPAPSFWKRGLAEKE